ncbi:hypothetical protein [Streptomyces sp. NPDC047841]|uniref:hypothetical protein n=1 Tax=Streptomyces sp. NPDC047841 TaxID=3154708 RepID=UPI00345589D3
MLFGSDWPFTPTPAGQFFANGLDTGVDATTLEAVNHVNAGLLLSGMAAPLLELADTPLNGVALLVGLAGTASGVALRRPVRKGARLLAMTCWNPGASPSPAWPGVVT